MTTATAQLTVIAEPGSHAVVTEREVAAPRDLVFRCFTEAALLAQWLGPRRMTMRVEELDVRHGGRWRYVNTDADGTEYGFRGVFHGTPSPERFVQTFEFELAPGYVSLDTLELVDLGGGRTLVRTSSVHQSVEARDAMVSSGMADGMGEGYAKLDELLATLQA